MEAWQLALLAWEGLKLLGMLVGAIDTPTPGPATVGCDHEIIREGRASCAPDLTSFTLPAPDDHWAVRSPKQ